MLCLNMDMILIKISKNKISSLINTNYLHFFTEPGRDVIRHPQAKILNSSTIIAIAVGGVILLLIVIDLLCCLIVNAGLFALMCRRTKRSPSDLDDETKIGRYVS